MPKYTPKSRYTKPALSVLQAHPFYQVGRDAFAAGIKCAPALDKAVSVGISELCAQMSQEERHAPLMTLMDAWLAGWVAANLEAPLPEID